MLKIAEYNTKTGKKIRFKSMLKKFEFHKGYNQHNRNYEKYGICENDDIRINEETKEIICNSTLWISYKDYYTWGGIDKIYDLIEAGYVIKESE